MTSQFALLTGQLPCRLQAHYAFRSGLRLHFVKHVNNESMVERPSTTRYLHTRLQYLPFTCPIHELHPRSHAVQVLWSARLLRWPAGALHVCRI